MDVNKIGNIARMLFLLSLIAWLAGTGLFLHSWGLLSEYQSLQPAMQMGSDLLESSDKFAQLGKLLYGVTFVSFLLLLGVRRTYPQLFKERNITHYRVLEYPKE